MYYPETLFSPLVFRSRKAFERFSDGLLVRIRKPLSPPLPPRVGEAFREACAVALLWVALWAFALGCASSLPRKDPRYQPAENLLDILADFQHHLSDDNYRYEPAQDITGKNIYRATLLRLESYEKANPNSLKPIVSFSRARALERLGDYEGAIRSYRPLTQMDSKLKEQAEKGLKTCQEFQETRSFSLEKHSLQDQLTELEKKRALWGALVEKYSGGPYESLAREEEERVDQERVRFLEDHRHSLKDGNAMILLAHQEMISKHTQSKKIDEHLLGLADFYFSLAKEYVQEHNPAGTGFDAPTFNQFTNSAVQIYGALARARYGKPERLEAKGKLEALRAFVDKTIGQAN